MKDFLILARVWVLERTGLDRVWETLFERRIPEAKGPVAWLYTLGSASLFVFIVQAVTGSLLAMNYVPSPDHAYDSVRFINEKVLCGSFIRGLHHWGASFMVVLVMLHMLRVFFMGSYKYPREGTWMTGVGLLLLVIGFGFTGYLLPWDQKAYWATTVGTNIAAQTPFVGTMISKVLKGGPNMGAATLTRFYALHVLVLPGLILLALGAHMFLVAWHGISEPPSRMDKTDKPQEWPR
jgi:quinol-cytochrome oxidoreductase complex cytochrome b subunit